MFKCNLVAIVLVAVPTSGFSQSFDHLGCGFEVVYQCNQGGCLSTAPRGVTHLYRNKGVMTRCDHIGCHDYIMEQSINERKETVFRVPSTGTFLRMDAVGDAMDVSISSEHVTVSYGFCVEYDPTLSPLEMPPARK